ncbi:MAG: hypothetical protein A4E54_01676 [Pelotomaculum sp. PtaB.Bin117]|nr:MAG: hypothetical protein A4E54_01676 [Pelotomaculum sp. PtaB.Bin117]OPY58123.1 MAG: hypothetical protein A4E56_03435 [Pelotomaculum sp. PtaU1.Bin065]
MQETRGVTDMKLYPLSGGVHTSALSDTRNLLVVARPYGHCPGRSGPRQPAGVFTRPERLACSKN